MRFKVETRNIVDQQIIDAQRKALEEVCSTLDFITGKYTDSYDIAGDDNVNARAGESLKFNASCLMRSIERTLIDLDDLAMKRWND